MILVYCPHEKDQIMNCAANWLGLCAALAAGEACGFALSRFASLWIVVAALGVPVVLALYAFGARWTRFVVTFLAGLVLALAAAHSRNEALDEATWRNSGKPFTRVFKVEGDGWSRKERNGVRWTSFPASADAVKVLVVFPRAADDPCPLRGETWECAGWLERMKVDDISRRRRLWVKGKGTFARRIESPRGEFAARLAELRSALSRRMGIGLDDSDPAVALNRAILLGEKSRLSKADRGAFAAAGTIHVFAISGLHVMLVAQTLFLVLALFGCPLRLAGVLLVPVLWFYVAMTGFSPSAVRAAAMATLHHLAPLFWRRQNGIVAWSLTFLFVYAMDPMKMHDIGCALSFSVMLGIMLWGKFTADFIKNRVFAAVFMSVAIWAVGTPIAAHAFGRVTPGGIIANLALIPAAGVSVKAALAGLMASVFSDRLAAYANNFAALVANVMAGLSHFFAHVPGANLEVAPWSMTVCVAWYAALAILLAALRVYLTRRKRTI